MPDTPPRGTDPTNQEKADMKGAFPNLKDGEFKKTGEATGAKGPHPGSYNCFEWTLCKTDEWLESGIDAAGNNDGKLDLDDFDKFYKNIGIEVCPDSPKCDPECKKRKIAIFCKDGKPVHGSKETDDGGWWESKLGAGPRIIHKLDQLEGGQYGDVCRCYCKTDNNANLKLCPPPEGNGDKKKVEGK